MAEVEQEKQPSPRVLFVDDYDTIRHLGEIYFKQVGIEPVTLSSAEEAVEALKNREFTHVYSDGLEGKWRQVRQAAEDAGVKEFAVVSENPIEVEAAEREGVKTFPGKLEFFLQIAELFREKS